MTAPQSSADSAGVSPQPCSMAHMPVLANHKAMCPECKAMVAVRMLDGLWCFRPHDAVTGLPNDGDVR